MFKNNFYKFVSFISLLLGHLRRPCKNRLVKRRKEFPLPYIRFNKPSQSTIILFRISSFMESKFTQSLIFLLF